jgi:carbon-monoxide dehydrogenase large subunit
MSATGIGASVRRKEDQRFITGKGRYVDDLNRPGQAYAAFVRSPHAHANLRSVDTSAAKGMPGVRRRAHRRRSRGRQDRRPDLRLDDPFEGRHAHEGGPHPALAQGKVRYVGDHVAVVIAETVAQAKDGAEAVTVDYDVLPAVVDRPLRRKPPCSCTTSRRQHGLSLAPRRQGGGRHAFASAKHVTKIDLVNNRLVPNPMEPRAAIGEYDTGDEAFTLYTTSQNPHVARLVLSAFIGIAPGAQAARDRARCRRRLRLQDLHLRRGDGLRLGGKKVGRP